jgi:hypothetical protein
VRAQKHRPEQQYHSEADSAEDTHTNQSKYIFARQQCSFAQNKTKKNYKHTQTLILAVE